MKRLQKYEVYNYFQEQGNSLNSKEAKRILQITMLFNKIKEGFVRCLNFWFQNDYFREQFVRSLDINWKFRNVVSQYQQGAKKSQILVFVDMSEVKLIVKTQGFEYWQNGACILNSGQIYNEKDQNKNICSNFAEEDCRVQAQCGFYLGQCINFLDCNIFSRDFCQELSYRCFSDGIKCVEMLECKNYKTENGCQNKNKNGRFCFWAQEMEKKCRDVIICEELPIYLISHMMCKEGLDGCTINKKGYGCIQQMDSCNQYLNHFNALKANNKMIIVFGILRIIDVLKIVQKSSIYSRS